MKYLIKISDGYIYPFTEVLEQQSGMREPTQKEIDNFFNVVGTQKKDETLSDEDVKEWAMAREIDNDKDAISQYSLAKFGKKANKQFNELNMIRELIRLENEQG